MNIIKIYERVTQTTAVDESSFIMYLNETVNELIGKYRPRYVILPDTVFTEVESIDDTLNVYDFYAQCITENIIFLITGDQNKKMEFINHAQQAYIAVYRELGRTRVESQMRSWY